MRSLWSADFWFAGIAKVTSTITLNCIGDLGALTVTAHAATVSPMIRCGSTGGNPVQLNGVLRMPRVQNSAYVVGSGWATFGVGIDLGNVLS